jgi:uncharacterized protein with HEPN domain
MNQIELLERQSRLWHIDHAVSMILEFVHERSIEDYESNDLMRSAVERQLITVGEALRRAVEVDPVIAAHISDTPQIISCRNFLVHNYPQIDSQEIWRIITTDLPLLLTEVRALLASADTGQNPA